MPPLFHIIFACAFALHAIHVYAASERPAFLYKCIWGSSSYRYGQNTRNWHTESRKNTNFSGSRRRLGFRRFLWLVVLLRRCLGIGFCLGKPRLRHVRSRSSRSSSRAWLPPFENKWLSCYQNKRMNFIIFYVEFGKAKYSESLQPSLARAKSKIETRCAIRVLNEKF